MKNKLLLFLLLSLLPLSSQAGFIELGTSFSYRKSSVDDLNFEERRDATFSISYYFWAQSAIEVSLTQGLNTTNVGGRLTDGSISFQNKIESEYQLIGLDFVLSLADPKAAFRPYIKAGGVRIRKKIISQEPGRPADVQESKGLAPSAGIGLKLKFTETMSLKIGAETWQTPLANDDKTFDYAGRVGISWIF